MDFINDEKPIIEADKAGERWRKRGRMSRTLNGEVLIDDNGSLNERVRVNNLLACAELLREANNDKETESVEE